MEINKLLTVLDVGTTFTASAVYRFLYVEELYFRRGNDKSRTR